jgi:hypothetical protein
MQLTIQNHSTTRCIVYDFSDDHCYYKDVRAAFDKYVAEKGVVAYRIDPMVARVSVQVTHRSIADSIDLFRPM